MNKESSPEGSNTRIDTEKLEASNRSETQNNKNRNTKHPKHT